MKDDIFSLSQRDKAILVGLFLSKFDKMALECLRFKTFNEAYNVLGYALNINPNSIRLYMNEFDPYFPNGRQGRHKRDMRDNCKKIMELAKDFSLDDFYRFINSFLWEEWVDIKDLNSSSLVSEEKTQISNRLITGRAAEMYFMQNYQSIIPFQSCEIIDTTNWGCGFDYKLSSEFGNYYIEVKGLSDKQGSILMTEKEYNMADDLRDRYCLFVVNNFKETPVHQMFFNPLYGKELQFSRKEQQIIQISYVSNIIRF